jgi:flagellar biosynthetic protein FliQ
MDPSLVLYIGRRMLETAMLVSAPVLVVTMVVGFLVAMLQAVTSIRDMTFGMVVKLACMGVTVLIAGGWMMSMTVDFTIEMFNQLRSVGLR